MNPREAVKVLRSRIKHEIDGWGTFDEMMQVRLLVSMFEVVAASVEVVRLGCLVDETDRDRRAIRKLRRCIEKFDEAVLPNPKEGAK